VVSVASKDPKTLQKAHDNIATKLVELDSLTTTFQGHQEKFRNDETGRLQLLVDAAIKRQSSFLQPTYTYQEKVEKNIRRLKESTSPTLARIQEKIWKHQK
jgi:seryl-tRNA(Sec) selenium transferase